MEASALSRGQPAPPSAVKEAAPTVTLERSAQSAAGGQRVAWLDAAKGIGILLVVLGHCLGGLFDAGLVNVRSGLWLLFYSVYVFHMPLFFLLSASLVYRRVSQRPARFWSSLPTRIVWPYLLWGTVQTAVIIAASGMVNHPAGGSIADNLLRILWVPPGQFWFLYALLFLHIAAGLAIRLGGKLLFAQAMALVYLGCMLSAELRQFVTTHISLPCILFYTLGVCFGDGLLAWRGRIPRPLGTVLALVIVWFASAWSAWTGGLGYDSAVTLPAAFAGTAAVILLTRGLNARANRLLSYLGQSSMPIYVLHVMFVAGARIALVHYSQLHDAPTLLPLIFMAGVVGPLLVYAAVRRLRLQHVLGLA